MIIGYFLWRIARRYSRLRKFFWNKKQTVHFYYLGYFRRLLDTIFFQNNGFFCFLEHKIWIFFSVKSEIFHAFANITTFGIVDKIWDSYELGHVFESRWHCFFIFQPKNILRSNLNFSTSFGRSTYLKSLLGFLSFSLNDLKKIFHKIMSTSVMSKLVK